ncbi:glycosyltransferase [Thioalkalivibrio paradoxus]|uniref:Metal-dependent hydrolase n=1 Tax=Thioalkalivibrio paradoxus ARh 1 TaxID=713585 RepID=W0DQJ9_9GAMM|nr:glycosyltransferase [Thioalkalivibrio paradoxus]AHE99145.1 metal-dependent hydrolase [Thioalkalivibrio paradoxus ARh 1]
MTGTAMRRRLGVPDSAPAVGTGTQPSEQKAPLDLVEAFAAIRAGRPDARFVIVGDGPLRAAVETRVRAHGLNGCVVMTGLRRDIPDLLPGFDVFVLYSRWEGLPRVLPQAMASGVPIVCTQVDGHAEAVRNGVEGSLVEPGRPNRIAVRGVDLLGIRIKRSFGSALNLGTPSNPIGTALLYLGVAGLYWLAPPIDEFATAVTDPAAYQTLAERLRPSDQWFENVWAELLATVRTAAQTVASLAP